VELTKIASPNVVEPDPTADTYEALTAAYRFFNAKLFDNRLPNCLVTLQRKGRTFGYFSPRRFGTRDGTHTTDEIALNPAHFRHQSTTEIYQTLVHEMTHLEQQHFGKPSRGGYHNAEWGELMLAVGLCPSDTGKPGGRRTGQRMGDYIIEDGPFDLACEELLSSGNGLRYGDLVTPEGRKPTESKVKYSCPVCRINAWGKAGLRMACIDCVQVMTGPGTGIVVSDETEDREAA
jgi:hypothetical protein